MCNTRSRAWQSETRLHISHVLVALNPKAAINVTEWTPAHPVLEGYKACASVVEVTTLVQAQLVQ